MPTTPHFLDFGFRISDFGFSAPHLEMVESGSDTQTSELKTQNSAIRIFHASVDRHLVSVAE